MDEYIKKDRTKELLCSMCKNGDYGCFGSNRCQWLKWVEESVADVVPVRHGRWIFHKQFDNGRHNCNECIECSVCNTWFGHDCYAKTNYCPNCGAKMDLEDEHHD